ALPICILIGGRGHGAGIQDNELRVFSLGYAMHPALCQLALYSGAVGLSSTAAEVLDVITAHGVIIASETRCSLHLTTWLLKFASELLWIDNDPRYIRIGWVPVIPPGAFDETSHPAG